jgi:aspartate/methionine/tyrosine aminotransferase
MKFADFQQFREKVLREQRDVLDCAATNLYAALARLIPPFTPVPEHTVHRCHLATEWGQHFGFPAETSRLSLVSCGVRDSLSRLFSHYKGTNACLWLPADNYPVYGELARAAGLIPLEFPTLPDPIWPDAPPTTGPELIVVTNPLKPLGRWLSHQDVAALIAWLHASPQRRLILDVVYTFDRQFHTTTLELVETEQTILLHSLTKGWLHPRLFGIALVPKRDAGTLADVFRALPPAQSNLVRARELLSHHADMPAVIAREIAASRKRLFSALPEDFPAISPVEASSYFMPIRGHWSDLLESKNVLGIPASVFGSPREDITILSSLNFVA